MVQKIDYQRKTLDQLKQEAENAYNPLYNTEKQSLQQRTQDMLAGLEGQRGGINKAYDTRLEQLKDTIGQTRTNAGNEALSRGFGRSTYVQDKLTDIDTRGGKAVDQLEYDRGQEHIGLDSRISQLNSQLADSIQRLDMDKATKISEMLRQLQQDDYSNYTNATQYNNSLTLQQQQLAAQRAAQMASQSLARQQFEWQKQQALAKQPQEYAAPTAQQQKSFDSYMANIKRDPSLKSPEGQLNWLSNSKDSLVKSWGEGLYNNYVNQMQDSIKNMPQTISNSYYQNFMNSQDKAQWLKQYGKELSKDEYEQYVKIFKTMGDNGLL